MNHFKHFSIFLLFLCFCITPLEAGPRGKKNAPFSNMPFSLIPPKGWECLKDPNQLPEKVKQIYIGTGKGKFTPSINIACEETSKKIEDYIQDAKKYHEERAGAKCQLLGKLNTQSGSAHLLQIDRLTEWGNVRFLQAALVHEGMAYVITATSLHEEFSSYSTLFLQAIQSFTIR